MNSKHNFFALIFWAVIIFSPKGLASEQLEVSGQMLQINGVAVHSELRSEWFLDALYLSEKLDNSNDIISNTQIKSMQMKVLATELSARRIKRFWIDRIRNNNDAQQVLSLAKDVRTFAALMGIKLVANDHVSIDFIPSRGTVVSINGSEVGIISGDLYPLILNTWIGPRPPSDDFKKAILGQETSNFAPLVAKFSGIAPSAQRVSEFDVAARAEAERIQKELDDARIAEEQRLEQERLAEVSRQRQAEASKQAEAAKVKAAQDAKAAAAKVVEQPIVEEVPAGPSEEELNALRNKYKVAINKHYSSSFKYPIRDIIRKFGTGIIRKPKKGKSFGTVRASLEVDRDGELVSGSITKSSGEKILDNAVSNALFDAVPYPSMPQELPEETYKLSLNITIPAPKG